MGFVSIALIVGGDCGRDRKAGACIGHTGVALTPNQRAADRSESQLPCGSHGRRYTETPVPEGSLCPLHLRNLPGQPLPARYGNKPVKVCRGAPFWHAWNPLCVPWTVEIVTGTGIVSFHCKSASVPGEGFSSLSFPGKLQAYLGHCQTEYLLLSE